MIPQSRSQVTSTRNSPLRPKLRTIVVQKKPSLLETPIEPKSANAIAKRRETVVRSLISKFKDTTSTQISLASKREHKVSVTAQKISSIKETLNFKRTQVFQFRDIQIPRRLISKSYENNSDAVGHQSVDRPSARGSPEKYPSSLTSSSRKNKISFQNLSAKRPAAESGSTDATFGGFTTRGFSFEDKILQRAQKNLRGETLFPEILTPTKIGHKTPNLGHKRIQSQRV